jgi:hypothetical protein
MHSLEKRHYMQAEKLQILTGAGKLPAPLSGKKYENFRAVDHFELDHAFERHQIFLAAHPPEKAGAGASPPLPTPSDCADTDDYT